MTLKEAAGVLRIMRIEHLNKNEIEAVIIALKALDNLRLICANAYIIEKLVREVRDYE